MSPGLHMHMHTYKCALVHTGTHIHTHTHTRQNVNLSIFPEVEDGGENADMQLKLRQQEGQPYGDCTEAVGEALKKA